MVASHIRNKNYRKFSLGQFFDVPCLFDIIIRKVLNTIPPLRRYFGQIGSESG